MPDTTAGLIELEPHSARSRETVWLRRAGVGVVGAQAIVMLVYSTHLYDRFDLTKDFAIYFQAWTQIAAGHLSPYSTLNNTSLVHYGFPFWRNHFELIMWPFALLWFVYPHGVDLLWIEDLAVIGATLVAFYFVIDLLERHWSGPRWGFTALACGAMVVLVANPWIWWSVSFDFHLQAVATLFVLLAARDLWAGRRRAWWWVGAVMLCGDVAATYLVGLGISALLVSRRTRRSGALLVGVGLAWTGLISGIGAAQGSQVAGNYRYLAHVAPGAKAGLGAILAGAVTHPTTPLHMFRTRLHYLYLLLAGSGLIGAVSVIGFGISVVVLVPIALNASTVFGSPYSAFQGLPVYFFVLVGSVAGLTWLLHRRWRPARLLVGPLAIALLVQSLVLSVNWIPQAPAAFLHVDAPAAAELAQVLHRIPSSAEVIASQGVVGRFAARRWVYPYIDTFPNGQTVPVFGSEVVFVLTPAEGIEPATPAKTLAAVAFVHRDLGATELASAHSVYALSWRPPKGTRSVTFPP